MCAYDMVQRRRATSKRAHRLKKSRQTIRKRGRQHARTRVRAQRQGGSEEDPGAHGEEIKADEKSKRAKPVKPLSGIWRILDTLFDSFLIHQW